MSEAMIFDQFLAAAKDPERRAKAIKGFAERQKKREEEFVRKGKMWEPTSKFYERSYDI